MAGVKEEESCTKEGGTSLAVVKQIQELRGVVLICSEADRKLIAAFKVIITAVIGRAKKGDIPSIKFLMELAHRAGRAEISDEEIETLGKMLMREFHALQEEDNGRQEAMNG